MTMTISRNTRPLENDCLLPSVIVARVDDEQGNGEGQRITV